MNTETKQEKTIIEEINEIFETHDSQRAKLQQVLIKSMLHIERHGDVGFIPHLVGKLESDAGRGLNREAVIKWINDYTKAVITYDASKKAHIVTFKRDKQNNIEVGKTTVWWSLKNKPNLTGFSLVDSMNQVVSLNSRKGKEKQNLIESGNIEAASKIETDSDLANAVKAMLTDRRYVEMVLEAQQQLANMPAVING